MRLSTWIAPIFFLLLASATIGISSCSFNPKPTAATTPDTMQAIDFEPAYSLFTSKNGVNQFLLIDSTWQQVSAMPIPHADFSREFILRKGFLYAVNPQTDQLIQYRLTSTGLQAQDSIQLANDNIEQYHWKNDSDTLIICNVVHGNTETSRLYEIDTKNFSLIREADLPIPPAVKDFDILSLGLVRYQDNTLWIAYAYSKMLGRSDYTTVDTMYYRTLDFASLRVLSEQKDARSTYPGGINTIQTYSGTAENGDYYFTSGPGIAAGNAIHLPSAIFRKQQGSDLVDTSFMINISAQTGNHAYGLWYLGDHKALIRGEQADKFRDFSNHHAIYQFKYYLVDLQSGQFQQLALPLDKGTRKENIVRKDSNLYIAIDDNQDRHSVWKYNLKSGDISQQLSPAFSIDYLLRLDKLR